MRSCIVAVRVVLFTVAASCLAQDSLFMKSAPFWGPGEVYSDDANYTMKQPKNETELKLIDIPVLSMEEKEKAIAAAKRRKVGALVWDVPAVTAMIGGGGWMAIQYAAIQDFWVLPLIIFGAGVVLHLPAVPFWAAHDKALREGIVDAYNAKNAPAGDDLESMPIFRPEFKIAYRDHRPVVGAGIQVSF